ncbi:MAG: polyketide cyclase [Bdellovibrionaceae bacterium]|nr:polyketide cyclase [Pseudobdellovibrionaceae bacterium]|tara:strand:+ start:19 stop:450 length:432 start_codon:yes stop_codon:yes gene_type:complete
MASASTTEDFDCTVEQFYSLITDYSNYSEFLKEVKKAKVVEDRGDEKLVQFDISLIKSFSYRLVMDETRPTTVKWKLDSGDVFKESNGYWKLEENEQGKCRAHYSVEAKFKVFVPGPIAKALVEVNLPNMISAYHKRVAEVYG